MRRPILRDNRGIALLMTLAFITLAVSLALETNRQSRFSITACTVQQHLATARQMASAGVHAAMALLIEDRYASDTDHLKEDWADPEKLNARLGAIVFEDGRLEVAIEDELARIQINALVDFPQGRQFVPLQQALLTRLIQTVREATDAADENTTAVDIVNAIKDWLDAGDDDAITGLNGAESDYYQGLEPPYNAGNGPIRHISELRQIKGLSETLIDGLAEQPGLRAYLTAYGAPSVTRSSATFPGAVNLNTVPADILRALLPPENQALADLIIEFRQEADPNVLASKNWPQQSPGSAEIALDPALITFASDFFRIRATAGYHNVKSEVTAVVERRKLAETDQWGCRIIAWESD
jgi:general secretion pathway protein K